MEQFTLGDFADAVGAAYSITSGEAAIELILECADELPSWSPETESFRLQFCGPSEPILPQAIYRLQRNGDTFEIFIVPIARDGAGTHYEAIFN
jgi:hypothetical protein